ncbi:MAG: hypothetical protein ACLQVY_15145 [Limisphaerales bacterium]
MRSTLVAPLAGVIDAALVGPTNSCAGEVTTATKTATVHATQRQPGATPTRRDAVFSIPFACFSVGHLDQQSFFKA